MIIGNTFDSFLYNIQKSLLDSKPPAKPVQTSSPFGSDPHGQSAQTTKRKDSNLDSLGSGMLL